MEPNKDYFVNHDGETSGPLGLEELREKLQSGQFKANDLVVAKGDSVLALKADGELLIFSLTPKEFKIIDTKKVSDQSTWAHLALCGDEIFVRELKGITKFNWK